MSSLDSTRRFALRLAAVAALALPMAACLRPLYGPTASGERMQDVLASIEVGDVNVPLNYERFSHYLRSDLIYDLDGSGQPKPKRYKLTVSATENTQGTIVDTITGRADSATIIGRATYTLYDLQGKTVATGTATQSATYDRTPQRFADVRAARDAEIRLSKLLSEQIKTRIAAVLLTAS
jgi:LPS-assembly lipoprotein